MQRYAVFDLDGTLIRWQLFHSVVDALAEQGKLSENLYSKVIESRTSWQQRKHEDAFSNYEADIVEAYESSLKDLSPDEFELIAKQVFDKHKDHVYVYTRNLMKELKTNGYMIFAVSGSFDIIVKMVASYYGFDDSAGSSHIMNEGKFTGEIDVIQHDRKVDKIKEFENKYNLTQKDSIAIGDSMGDISMLKYVQNPIIFNPVKNLYVEAKNNKWDIVIERKNVIYKLSYSDGNYVLS